MDKDNPQLAKLLRTVSQLENGSKNTYMGDGGLGSKSSEKTSEASRVTLGGRQMDEATTQELQELQAQYQQIHRDLQVTLSDLQKSEKEQKIAEITKGDIADLAGEARCYRSVGKMFLLSSKDNVDAGLKEKIETSKVSQVKLKEKVAFLEKRLKTQEQSIKELTA